MGSAVQFVIPSISSVCYPTWCLSHHQYVVPNGVHMEYINHTSKGPDTELYSGVGCVGPWGVAVPLTTGRVTRLCTIPDQSCGEKA